jgi:4-hydroxy-3-methylbut-2-enyl diphosphate reductase IspH
VIFSAHGVSRAVERDAEARGLIVHNATCPLVSKIHIQGRKYVAQGRELILIGHGGHPEIEGTMGQIDGPVHLVQSEADVAALDIADDTPVAYVTQTTLREISEELGVPAHLIADRSEMRREWIARARAVGVTAGASAPESLVRGVVEWLGELGPIEVSTVGERFESIEFKLPADLANVEPRIGMAAE